MESCDGEDREEFVALSPKVTAMERSFYRWRKDASDSKAREQGLALGIKHKDHEPEDEEFGCTDINNMMLHQQWKQIRQRLSLFQQPQEKEQSGTI